MRKSNTIVLLPLLAAYLTASTSSAQPGGFQSFNPDISAIVDMYYHADDSRDGISHVQEVVHDACLSIQPGTLLPFVGPNGAGKTTLLRAILGLLNPVRGSIRTPFAGKPAGYVPQQKSIDPLYPVTTRQIVGMGLYPELGWWRRPGAEQKSRIAAVLERFSLTAHQEKTFGELSGGMRQKTLLARALVSGADVFIMDEPTSELDEESEKDVLKHLYALAQNEGKTVLLAHHGLEQAGGLANEVCVVHHGRVQLSTIPEARTLLSATSSAGGRRHA